MAKFNFKKHQGQIIGVTLGAAAGAVLDRNVLEKVQFLQSERMQKLKPFIPALIGIGLVAKAKQESLKSAGIGMIAYSGGVFMSNILDRQATPSPAKTSGIDGYYDTMAMLGAGDEYQELAERVSGDDDYEVGSMDDIIIGAADEMEAGY
ncbi:MAG: hypothetical protein ACK5XP_07970 [Sphingobacteriia bacterium]|jgi:hypothetical protein